MFGNDINKSNLLLVKIANQTKDTYAKTIANLTQNTLKLSHILTVYPTF